jgi:acyl carrier protein
MLAARALNGYGRFWPMSEALQSDRFVQTFATYFGFDGDDMSRDMRLVEDLAFDSVSMYELMSLLEELSGRELPPGFADGLLSVNDVCHYIEAFS